MAFPDVDCGGITLLFKWFGFASCGRALMLIKQSNSCVALFYLKAV